MLRLATALFGMTTSNVLLVTRGTANLMEKNNVRWSWINTEELTAITQTYRFGALCLISSLMLLP
jgi:hypothetical protein